MKKLINNIKNIKKWFTLIEVMIVIIVFSIGVLAVLKMIISNMSAMDSINKRTTATFLAKEGIALVYSMRDSNRLAGLPRDCVANQNYDESHDSFVCSDYMISGNNNIWKIGLSEKGKKGENWIFAQYTTTGNSRLYLNTWVNWIQYYNYDSNWEETVFSRYILFTGIVENDNVLPKDRIVKIESHVVYNRWNAIGDVVLESFIWNY